MMKTKLENENENSKRLDRNQLGTNQHSTFARHADRLSSRYPISKANNISDRTIYNPESPPRRPNHDNFSLFSLLRRLIITSPPLAAAMSVPTGHPSLLQTATAKVCSHLAEPFLPLLSFQTNKD